MKKFLLYAGVSFSSLLMILSTGSLSAQTEQASKHPNLLLPEFKEGTIVLKTGASYSVPLNFDKINQRMIVEKGGQYRILQETGDVDTITIDGRVFIISQGDFYELAVNSTVSFFIRHLAKLETTGSPTGYGAKTTTASITHINKLYGSEAVSLEIPENYKVADTPEYYVRINGEWTRFSNKKQFAKAFAGKEDQINSYLKQNKTSFRNTEDLKSLVRYCNTLYL